MNAEEIIRSFALDHEAGAGFDAVRFTTPAAPGHGAAMRAWLDAGMHGEMGYLENRATLRAGDLDDENLLPGAASVIVVAQSYDFKDGNGRIARYARGADYHDVLRGKLNRLAAFIAENFPGHAARGFTDSGPIRERELAARAGIGWQGKHTNLIALDLGNFFFLGALLTTLPLAPDTPEYAAEAHCGTCTRCLAACPTGALVAPHTLDARRCISYLTIELRGPIPLELRPLIGERIFGCDDCLAACPWNERARLGRERQLAARDADAANPDLLELLAVCADDAAFRARFRGTPLFRTKRDGLRRNVCVALGNVGGTEALGPLAIVARSDASEIVQEAAQWAIAQIGARNLLH